MERQITDAIFAAYSRVRRSIVSGMVGDDPDSLLSPQRREKTGRRMMNSIRRKSAVNLDGLSPAREDVPLGIGKRLSVQASTRRGHKRAPSFDKAAESKGRDPMDPIADEGILYEKVSHNGKQARGVVCVCGCVCDEVVCTRALSIRASLSLSLHLLFISQLCRPCTSPTGETAGLWKCAPPPPCSTDPPFPFLPPTAALTPFGAASVLLQGSHPYFVHFSAVLVALQREQALVKQLVPVSSSALHPECRRPLVLAIDSPFGGLRLRSLPVPPTIHTSIY